MAKKGVLPAAIGVPRLSTLTVGLFMASRVSCSSCASAAAPWPAAAPWSAAAVVLPSIGAVVNRPAPTVEARNAAALAEPADG